MDKYVDKSDTVTLGSSKQGSWTPSTTKLLFVFPLMFDLLVPDLEKNKDSCLNHSLTTTFSPLCVSLPSDPPSTAPFDSRQKYEQTVLAATLCGIALSQMLGEMLVVWGPTISIISQRRSRLNYQHGCVQTGAQLITLGWSPCCLCPRSPASQLTTWRFIGGNGSARGNNSEKLSSSALPFLTLSAPSGVAVTGQTHFTLRCITPVPPLVGMLRCASARLLLMIIAFFILGNQRGPPGDAQTCSFAPFFFICAFCARISILVCASWWEPGQKQGAINRNYPSPFTFT